MKTQKPKKEFSHKVTLVSFIMSIFVIYIHANNLAYYGIDANGNTIANLTVNILGNFIGEIAVPFFFMMSGYWLFRMDVEKDDIWKCLGSRLRKKTKTLVIPYLLWNTFGMIFYMTITHIPFISSMMNNGDVISVNFSNIFEGIFLHKYYFTFWYMQDLIVLTFVSPIFMFLLKKIRRGVFALIATFLLNLIDIDLVIFGTSSLWFFFSGAFMAVFLKEKFEKRNNGWIYLGAFIVMGIPRYFETAIIGDICYLFSPMILWKAFDALLPKRAIENTPYWFENQSFFIYAAHVIPVTIIGHLFAKMGGSVGWATISYLIAPWITLGLLFLGAKTLNIIMPGFYNLICGNRGRNRN
ncbi:MAG: acyltransferase [Eubacteriales bacterium]|nr:acyltransferase [Eubacteriales bacterium]